ncbi:hypothetical protein [Catenuloplanes atrovinosus]|uniref:Uncharacterized protein n=1 Tax=Catenuloplanes atrovinosus TaxID=137266 RepID=A0AAE4CDM2_9ACTN|nr:hypothetical protein [Catenuloplanes atrovinosus]MDR7277665.1 hypothetical protein [Catenuloplanes atrovinosus]
MTGPADGLSGAADSTQQAQARVLRHLHTSVSRLRGDIAAMRKNNRVPADLGTIRRQLQRLTDVADGHLDRAGVQTPLDHIATRAAALAADVDAMRLDTQRPADLRTIRWRLQNMTELVDDQGHRPGDPQSSLDEVATRAKALLDAIAAIRLDPHRGDLQSIHQQLRGMAALVNEDLGRDAPISPSVEAE